MQKRAKLSIIVASITAAVAIGGVGWYQSAYADSQQSTPGYSDDPIVTKSYVDQKVAELVKQELDKIGAGTGSGGASSSAKLEVVTVPFGKKIIVEDGGELIIRAGKAIAYSTDANGLSDMTDGLDIAPGKAVGNNHLILFPRGGRGVEADPKQKNGLTVLVRGKYLIN
ncbi:hypothetical protein [Cohnella nanjingensis]|uniref:Uncharacterized protein n=1 Tax=Cohnella nanjingensis TaxID=1387779 RepID=A0A7X0RNN3_9BACL|nr:hypothetical protein [Cohnella nanjingensis]MBB6670618.1 hypothetical protein [Cohnella nanjingensis]